MLIGTGVGTFGAATNFSVGGGSTPYVDATLTNAQLTERQRGAIEQNMVTLRNRVNELGVTEPIVQQQGASRIAVQLPGVTNSAEVKDILGRVATLEFRLTDTQNNVTEALQRGRVIGLYILAFLGMSPIGHFLSGALAERIGVQWTLFLCGSSILVAAACFAYSLPSWRESIRLDRAKQEAPTQVPRT